jgi:hydroxypyruvate reductase
VTFAISDVHGPVEDDPAVIGSGPTVADPTTFADAEQALRGAGLLDGVPASIRERLARGARGEVPETLKRGDRRLTGAEFVLAGSRRDAMYGACVEAAERGYLVERIGPATVGEAALAARAFVARVRSLARDRACPLCVVAAGETTVTLPLSGSVGAGGRNQEFALAARGLRELGICVLAASDRWHRHPDDAAGAIADATTVTRGAALGLDADAVLAAHDAYPFFGALDDLVVTGPTGTNVGDLQIFLVTP